eukprot:g80613.t1
MSSYLRNRLMAPPRTMIDSRIHLVQIIITTIGALRPPTENESPPLHPVSISWIAQAKMLQLLDLNLTPGKAGDAGLALRGFLRLLRSTCTQFRPATVSVHRWLPDIVKSTSCDSCPETVQSVSWGLPIILFIDEGDPSPITITELLGRWRTPYHFSSPNPCRRCGSLSSFIQRLLGDHAECLIVLLEVIRPQGLSNYLWSKKHHHKTIFPPRLVLHHEFSHQQATESYQLQSVLCVQASEDNAGTIITHTYVLDRQSDGTWIQCDDDSVHRFLLRLRSDSSPYAVSSSSITKHSTILGSRLP